MFVSFFPNPRLFFLSAVLWSAIGMAFWYMGGDELGAVFGLPPAPEDAEPVVGVDVATGASSLANKRQRNVRKTSKSGAVENPTLKFVGPVP